MLINDYNIIIFDEEEEIFDFDENEEDFDIDDEIFLEEDVDWIRKIEGGFETYDSETYNDVPKITEEEFSNFITDIPVPAVIAMVADFWKENFLEPGKEFQMEDACFKVTPLEMDTLVIEKKARDGSWVEAAIAPDGEGGYRWVV